MTSARRFASPLGSLQIACTPFGLSELKFSSDPALPERAAGSRAEARLLDQAEAWLTEYFGRPAQKPVSPLPPLAPVGTTFEREVWRALGEIPYGEVASYADLAQRLGRTRGASRAVGQANGKNPLPLFVPCHRVIAAGGKLGGFSAGLDRKQWLLAHEGVPGFSLPLLGARADSYGVF